MDKYYMTDFFQGQPDEIKLKIFYELEPKASVALCASSKSWQDFCADRKLRMDALRYYYATLPLEKQRQEFQDLLSAYLSLRQGEQVEALIQLHPSWANEVLVPEVLLAEPETEVIGEHPLELAPSTLTSYILLKYGANPNASYPILFNVIGNTPWELDLFLRFGADYEAREKLVPLAVPNPESLSTLLKFKMIPSWGIGRDLVDSSGVEARYYSSFKMLIDKGWSVDPWLPLTRSLDVCVFYLLLMANPLLPFSKDLINALQWRYPPSIVEDVKGIYRGIKAANSRIMSMEELIEFPFEVLLGQESMLNDRTWIAKYERDFGTPPVGIHPIRAYIARYTMPVVKLRTGVYTLSYDIGLGLCVAMSILTSEYRGVKELWIAGRQITKELYSNEVSESQLLPRLFGLHSKESLRSIVLAPRDEGRQALPSKDYTMRIKDYIVQFNSLEFIKGVAILCREERIDVNRVCSELKHWKYD